SHAPPLPLGSQVHSIALVGPLGDSAINMLGSWIGKGDPADAVTLRAALTAYAAQHHLQLTTEKGVEIIGGSDAGIAAAVESARRSDVVLLAVGENAAEMTGEAASRAHLGLPGLQKRLVESVLEAGKPVVLIVFGGRPLVLTAISDKVSAIVQAWFPGVQAGPALVRLLTGEVNFSGKITVSYPRAVGQEPLYYNQLNTGRPAGNVDLSHPPQNSDEKYVSRYIDERNSPLFPFGYGLSYTKFEYGPPAADHPSISARALNAGTAKLTVEAEVRNIGARDGVEIVELYIGLRGTSVARPVRELKGFRRVALRAGESRRVEFTLGRDELSFWNVDMHDVVEPAQLTVWIAPDSSSGSSVEVKITE
ncbi:MAG TPA: glycoside hydrolase family 3 C-terminal domain-containing protein, partial [Terriglobales bacterium]|nr:glycoside hydrolase family 3 C-terminal domain-containing protein [Terriglobales bacterium]